MDRAGHSANDTPRAEIEGYYRTVAPFIDDELDGRADLPFWRALAAEAGDVLELGAGTGRVTAELAATGARVVGLDLSWEMLRRARARPRTASVRWIQADLRALALRRRFDLIVAADDPWSHLRSAADRRGALRGAAEHLRPGGRLVLDALWFRPAERAELTGPRGRIRSFEGRRGLRVVERWRADRHLSACSARYEYRRGDRLEAVAAFRGRAWSADGLLEAIREAGLRVESVWGDFDRRPWEPSTSARLIVSASAVAAG